MLLPERLTTGARATPVPVRLIDCGLLPALSAICTDADLDPAVKGENVTLIEQPALCASVLPQLFVCANSLLLVPVTLITMLVSEAFPLFVTVTDWELLVLPSF
jgi:hypothetical protein